VQIDAQRQALLTLSNADLKTLEKVEKEAALVRKLHREIVAARTLEGMVHEIVEKRKELGELKLVIETEERQGQRLRTEILARAKVEADAVLARAEEKAALILNDVDVLKAENLRVSKEFATDRAALNVEREAYRRGKEASDAQRRKALQDLEDQAFKWQAEVTSFQAKTKAEDEVRESSWKKIREREAALLKLEEETNAIREAKAGLARLVDEAHARQEEASRMIARAEQSINEAESRRQEAQALNLSASNKKAELAGDFQRLGIQRDELTRREEVMRRREAQLEVREAQLLAKFGG
jgi:chromosome segregation ATPase